MAGSSSVAVDRPAKQSDLADWLLAHGRHWVTTAEAAALLDIPMKHVSPTLARARAQALLFSPTKGAYVPIPPEYRSWRAVPAASFIDPMMRFLQHDYYVALLSAAEVHGFASQRPQAFQVMTSARLRDRSFGRVKISFITSATTASRPTIAQNTPTGTMRVSTPEAIALDLVALPRHSGGLSNVATILGEMVQARALDSKILATLAAAYPAAVAQRAGWLLESAEREVGRKIGLAPLRRVAALRTTPTLLEPHGSRRGALDEQWNIIVNGSVEPDL